MLSLQPKASSLGSDEQVEVLMNADKEHMIRSYAECANDKKKVPVDGTGSALSESTPNGKVFFCSESCHQAWLKKERLRKIA